MSDSGITQDASALIAAHAGVAAAHHTPTVDVAREATVAMFQANNATGTMGNPDRLNDNVTDVPAQATVQNQYCIVVFDTVVLIKRWRQFGFVNNNADGVWKIQYYNLTTHTWVDWVTGIPTRTASWTTLATETEVFTDKIKIIATTLDSGTVNGVGSGINELEVIY